jgi:hypothetical protein
MNEVEHKKKSEATGARGSDFYARALASDTTAASKYSPSEYERLSYYNGIAGDGGHPELLYRSDFLTTPYPKPIDGHIPVKWAHGVFNTPLNNIWETVAPEIINLIKTREVKCTSVSTVRFFTHEPPGYGKKGSFGPIVIWISVKPGSTSSETAHDVSQEILALLLKNGVQDVVVE